MVVNRRQFLSVSSVALAASTLDLRHLLAGQAAQPAPAPPETAFTALRGGVGIFTGQGGTIGWFIDKEGVVVVDSQMPATAAICLAGITERAQGRGVDRLINTHHHWDHTGGNGVFKPKTTKIVAQENVPGLQRAAAARQPRPPGMPGPDEQVVATATFTNTWTEKIGGETVALKYYGPAHTGGDSVVTFENANVVHMGDLVFNRRHPYIDRPGGASIAGWITVLERTVADHGGDTTYVFGHAGTNWPVTGTRADLAHMRDYFTALMEHVRGEMKAGKPRDVIVASTGTLKGFDDFGPLIERVLTAAYDELAG